MSNADDESLEGHPRGIVVGDAFMQYIEELRETWPAQSDRDGKPTEHGHPDYKMSKSSSDANAAVEQPAQPATTESPNMGRRRYMQLLGASAVAATVGTGAVSAQSETLNYKSEFVQNPRIAATMTIAEHRREEFSNALAYINDSGNQDSLGEAGALIAERDGPDTVHNPVTLAADYIDSEELYAFPRGETYDHDNDTNTDEEPVYALDATHWTTDSSGTAGTLTFADKETPAGTTGLHVATSGQGAGDVAKATFSNFEDITSGVDRKYLQLVSTVDTLGSSAVVYVRVRDTAGNVKEAVMDTGADGTLAGTITTSTGAGQVFQSQLGELSTTLDDITEIEIAVAEGDADITLTGLNLERESEWNFGTEEFLDSDSNVDTQTITEPSGWYSITGIDTLGDEFSSAVIHDVDVDVEFWAGAIGSDGQTEYDFDADASPYDYPNRLNNMIGWDLPTAYDLSYANVTLEDETRLASTRYLEGSIAIGLDELPSISDHEDISWTDKTSTYESANIGDEITLSTSPTGGEIIAVYFDALYKDSEKEDALSASGGGGGGAVGSSGGFFSSIEGILMSVGVGIAGYFAFIRDRLGA